MHKARVRSILVFACLVLGMALPSLSRASAVYPVNACVSMKNKLAANYCHSVLFAWSIWDETQDSTKRDAALNKATTSFGDGWIHADTTALHKAVVCSETTLSNTDMQAHLDSALNALITSVNTGLDLTNPDQAACGAAILKAAATKCKAFLMAQSKFIKLPSKDPLTTTRGQSQTKASQRFNSDWMKATSGTCPTSATESSVEAAIDALNVDVVLNTTVSPSVNNASFDTITPDASVVYEKRTYTPMCSHGDQYYFFAKRGTVNKLLMYYQGGGACWDYFTCGVAFTFKQNVDPTSSSDNPNLGTHVGFDDLTNPNNPFKDWNIVFVPYCTGDVHLGDAVQTYTNGTNSVTIQHRGFDNARVAEKWAREHFVNPDQVFVTGSSAGAYGALLNGVWLEQVYPASDYSVLGDAGNGVITDDFRMNYFPNWNVNANLPTGVPGLTQLTVPESTIAAANFYPRSRWAHYATAFDGGTGGQTGFYNVMLNPGNVGAWLSWWNASCAWNSIMLSQAQSTYGSITTMPNNYRYYVGTGSRHTMFGNSKVYSDTTGGVPTLVDWINSMLNNDVGWTNVVASNFGLLLSGDPQPSPLAEPFEQMGSDVVVNCPTPTPTP